MKHVITALCTALVATLAACTGGGDDYFPFVSGQRYEYDVERTTSDGVRRFRYFVDNLAGDARGRALIRESAAGHRLFFEKRDAGIVLVATQRRGKPRREAQPGLLELPQPVEVGTTWSVLLRTSVLENIGPPQETLYRIEVQVPVAFVIAATDAAIEVPAGRFENCVHVQGTGQVSADVGNYIGQTTIALQLERWYAPGVGLVHEERRETTTHRALARGEMVMTLRSL